MQPKIISELMKILKCRSLKELAITIGMAHEQVCKVAQTGKFGYSFLCHASEATGLNVAQLKALNVVDDALPRGILAIRQHRLEG